MLRNQEDRFGWDSVARFAEQEMNGHLDGQNQEWEFPRHVWRQCGEYGLLGVPFPVEYGGQGADAKTAAVAMEAMGYGCRDNGLLAAINAHLWSCVVPIWKSGTEEQKKTVLPKLCSGEWIAAHAATEPEAGSDIFSMTTRAERKGDGYVINGRKKFILNAPLADVVVLFATVDPQLGAEGITTFIVEKGTRGMSLARVIRKMGLHNAVMGELVFTDCEIPAENRVGPEGKGSLIFHTGMQWERTLMLAPFVGTMRRVLEKCIQYARRRKQFGQSIGKFQSVSNRIAEMKMRVECARLLLYQAADFLQRGQRQSLEASLAKLYISEAAVETSLDAVRIHGALGYTEELEFGQDLRDSIGATVFSGTSDVQRQIIARYLGL